MRLLIWMIIGGASFLIGWSATRWIVQPHRGSIPHQNETTLAVADSRESPPQLSATSGGLPKGHIEAIADLSDAPATLTRDHALAATLLTLDAEGFRTGADEMLALLSTRSVNASRRELAEAWMDRWLEIDTPGALQFLDRVLLSDGLAPALRSAPPLESGIAGIIRALARREPEWTRQLLITAALGEQREVAISTLLEEVAKGGAAQAASYLETFAKGADRPVALIGYITGLVNTDVRAALERAWAEPPGVLREQLLRLVFIRAGESDIALMSELLQRVDDPTARRRSLACGLQAAPPKEALPLIQEETEKIAAAGEWEGNHFLWLQMVEKSFQTPEGQAYAEWALNFQPDEEGKIFAQIAYSWVGRDPTGFRSWLSEHAASLDSTNIAKLAPSLGSMANRDAAATRAWSETLPPGLLRDQARLQLALRSGTRDIAYAAAAYEPVAASDTSGTLAAQIADIMASQDCAAAGEWALEQTSIEQRLAALRKVGKAWAGRDPATATQWMEKLPAGPERDAALGSYASTVVRADPEGAAAWTELVASPEERTKTATAVYYYWSKEDPAAARAWFRTLGGLDKEAVPAFLKHLR